MRVVNETEVLFDVPPEEPTTDKPFADCSWREIKWYADRYRQTGEMPPWRVGDKLQCLPWIEVIFQGITKDGFFMFSTRLVEQKKEV